MRIFFFDLLLICLVFIGLLFLWIKWTVRKGFVLRREKASPFECGFDPKDKARLPFSLRFFLLVILFIIFDVELALLLQLPFQLKEEFFKNRFVFIIFFWILLIGALEEWRRGVLDWKV